MQINVFIFNCIFNKNPKCHIWSSKGSIDIKKSKTNCNQFKFIRVKTKWASSKVPWADALYVKKDKVNFHKLFISYLHKFFEKFSIYYIFIDPYRKYQKIKYKLKQRVKNFLS